MQNNTVNVNAQSVLSVSEMETLLRAEVEMTGRGMREHLQCFADIRDRNMAARQQLAELLDGRVE